MPAESDDATTLSVPQWMIPPPGGFTADDFLKMRGLPRHTELIDGSLVFVSPQQPWHQWIINLLWFRLDEQAPAGFRAQREMTIKLAKRQCPEPDVLVVTEEAHERLFAEKLTYFHPEDVSLVVEAVSPDSEDRDRDTKPLRYAAAGIRHYWRVEADDLRAVVYVYELDPATGAYSPTGIYHDRLKLTVPFDIDIGLTRVGRKVHERD
ncbi:Uma2 family endonuclease [Actinomadura miaoliensis]|uniref:Uma2 family endonuclease n=1 Tax=Actinomadura miaoliensis TaxID=430685 RepID=A0ABP7WQC2_9ACTN